MSVSAASSNLPQRERERESNSIKCDRIWVGMIAQYEFGTISDKIFKATAIEQEIQQYFVCTGVAFLTFNKVDQ